MAAGPFTKGDVKVLKWAGAVIAVLALAMWVKGPTVQTPTSTVDGAAPTTTTSSPRYYSGYTTAPAPVPVTAAPAPPAADGEVVTVTRVVDGDTFEVTGGRRIRVLGIDSCEASTAGGREATETARSQLTNPHNAPITLLAEPGVDRDRYDRELRYVHLGGVDYGEFVVGYDHTGVYEGRNDASPSYLERLRASDAGGRSCSGAPTTTAAPSDPDVYVDNDDDGDDGESRFCRRRWYC